MKKKALVSSLLVIALCLSLIVGSTFALFTSESTLSIAVNSAQVKLIASFKEGSFEVFSVEAKDGGSEVDENGHTYEHVARPDNKTFYNGGTAVQEGSEVKLDRVTPGDKVNFTVIGTNDSNVKVMYRYRIECLKGFELAHGMTVTINGTKYDSLSTYVSAWTELAAHTDMDPVDISIEMLVDRGNEYQNLKDTSYNIVVEAVQANGVTEGEAEITYINRIAPGTTAEEISAMMADPDVDHVVFGENMSLTINDDIKDKILDGAGSDVALTLTGNLENVVVTNIVDTDGSAYNLVFNGTTGNVTVTDCTLLNAGGDKGAIKLNSTVDLTIDKCNFAASGEGKSYSMWGYGNGNLTITQSTFTGFGSWAIMVNGNVIGDVTIEGCTFTDCQQGIFKAGVKGNGTGTVEGTVNFNYNTIENCTGEKNNDAAMFGGNLAANMFAEGNVRDGASWNPDASHGFVGK